MGYYPHNRTVKRAFIRCERFYAAGLIVRRIKQINYLPVRRFPAARACIAKHWTGIGARAREQIREEELNSRLGRPGGREGGGGGQGRETRLRGTRELLTFGL